MSEEVVTVGLGTHRRLLNHGAIVRAAIEAGCGYVDTAPNYGAGLNQREVGRVIQDPSVSERACNIYTSTKVGFLSPLVSFKELAIEGVDVATITQRGHSLSPDFIRFQVARNRQELGVETIDLLFLHNPEEQLREGTKSEAVNVFLNASEVCEQLCAEGNLRSYGIATWRGFLECVGVQELCKITRKAFGEGNHFAAIQLPVSLISLDPVSKGALDGEGPLIEARAEGLQVFGSSPLHSGELTKVMTQDLVDVIEPSLTAAQAALHVILSTKLVNIVLVGTNNPLHFAEAVAVSKRNALTTQRLRDIVRMLL